MLTHTASSRMLSPVLGESRLFPFMARTSSPSLPGLPAEVP